MSKTRSFLQAGAILGGTVIVTAAVAPLFLPNQNTKDLTSAEAAEAGDFVVIAVPLLISQ